MWMVLLFAISAGVVGVDPKADAGFILALDNPATGAIDAIIPDGSVGDLYPLPGVIVFSGAVGPFFINVTTALSKPILGGPNLAQIDVNDVSVSGGAGTLKIMATDTDFTLPDQELFPIVLTNAIGGTTGGTVSAQAYLDEGNGEFVTVGAHTTGPQGPFGPGAFSGTSTFTVVPHLGGAGPFSLTEVLTITHTAGVHVTSFDKELSASVVPEPGSVAGLVGIAAFGLIGWFYRRQRHPA
jgi:hypothetical protein